MKLNRWYCLDSKTDIARGSGIRAVDIACCHQGSFFCVSSSNHICKFNINKGVWTAIAGGRFIAAGTDSELWATSTLGQPLCCPSSLALSSVDDVKQLRKRGFFRAGSKGVGAIDMISVGDRQHVCVLSQEGRVHRLVGKAGPHCCWTEIVGNRKIHTAILDSLSPSSSSSLHVAYGTPKERITARCVGMGSDGTIYCIADDEKYTSRGGIVYMYQYECWCPLPGRGVDVCVVDSRHVYVVSAKGDLFRWRGDHWQPLNVGLVSSVSEKRRRYVYRDNDARTSNKANSNGNNDNNDDNDNNDHNDHNDNKDNDDSNDHNDINDNNDNNDFTDRNDDNDENGNNGNKGSEKKCTSSTSSSSSTPPSVASGLSNFTLYGVETLHQVKLRKVSITLSSSSSFSSLASFSSASLSINGSLDHDIKARDAAIAKKSSSNDDRNEVDENDDKAITDHNRHKNKTNNCKLNDTDTGVAGGRGSNATTTATMEELLTILALGQDGKVYVCQLYDDDHYARNICSLSSSSSSSTVARAGSTPSISSLPCPFPPSSVSPLMTRTATTITTSLYSTPPLSSAPVVANGNYTNAKSAADKVSIGTPVNNDARIERDTYKANVCGIVHDKWKRRGKLKLPTHIEPGRGAASDRTRRRRVDTDCHNETHFDSASGTNNCMSETDDNNTNTQISDYDSEDEGDDVEDAIDSLDVYRPQFTPRSLLECWYALEVHYTTLSSIMSPVYVEYMINRYLPILKFDSAEEWWPCTMDHYVRNSSLWFDGMLLCPEGDLTPSSLPDYKVGSSSADFFDPCLYPDQLVDTNNLDHRVFTRGVSASGGDRRNEDNKSEKCNSTEVKEKLAGNTTKNQRKEKCISNCDSNSNSHSNGDMNTVSESSCGKNRHINDKPHSKHHQQRNPRLNPYYHHRYQRTRFELHPNKRIYKGVGNNDRVNDVPLYADMRYNKLLHCYEIRYFLFFAYNGWYNILGMTKQGHHEADLEHCTVRVDCDTLEIREVYFGSHGSMDGCWRRGTDVIRGSRDYDREKRRRKAEKQKRDQSHRKSHTTHSECNTRTPHALKQKRAGQHEKELEEKKKEGEKDDFLDLRIHNTENDDDGDGNGMVEGDKVKEEENSLWTHFDRLYIGQKGEVSDDNITTANNSSDIYEGRRDDTTETANCSKVNMHRYWYNPNLRLIEKERQRVAERRRKENEEEKKKIRSHASPLPLSSFARSATSVTDTSTSSSMSDFTSFSTDSPSSATNMHLPSLIVERPLREILHDRVVCYVARAFHGTYPGPGTFRRFVVCKERHDGKGRVWYPKNGVPLMQNHKPWIDEYNTKWSRYSGCMGDDGVSCLLTRREWYSEFTYSSSHSIASSFRTL